MLRFNQKTDMSKCVHWSCWYMYTYVNVTYDNVLFLVYRYILYSTTTCVGQCVKGEIYVMYKHV